LLGSRARVLGISNVSVHGSVQKVLPIFVVKQSLRETNRGSILSLCVGNKGL